MTSSNATIPAPGTPQVPQHRPSARRPSSQLERQRRCPLVRAACRLGEPTVVADVLRLHRPRQCSAVTRAR
jgi:hypothetical protein